MDILRFDHLKKAILYLAAIVVALTLQDLLISHIVICGAKAMFMPAVIVVIAYCEGGFYAGIMGIVAGILCDNALAGSDVTCTVLLPLIGFFSGVLFRFVVNRSLLCCMAVSFVAIALTAVGLALPAWLISGSSMSSLMTTAAVQSVWSLVFAFPAWWACRGISSRCRKEQNE